MGSFNITGFLSNQIITRGDKCVCFISMKSHKDWGFMPIRPVVPVYLPLIGEYDDYGCVRYIEEGPVKSYLDKLTGVDANRLVYLIDNDFHRSLEDNEKEELKSAMEKMGLNDKLLFNDYKICILIEHYDIFETISSFLKNKVDKSYELSVQYNDLFEKYYKAHMTLGGSLDEREDAKWAYISKFDNDSDIMNCNPNIDSGYLASYIPEMEIYKFLWTFKEGRWRLEPSRLWMQPEFAEPYKKMISCYYACYRMNLRFRLNNWGSWRNERSWYRKLNASRNRILKEQGKKSKLYD